MFNNIYKIQSICKKSIRQKIVLATITIFLLGNRGCLGFPSSSGLRDNQSGPSVSDRLKGQQATSQTSSYPSLQDQASRSLGVVSYLKRDHQIALIEIDAPDQFGGNGYKKMGLLLYTSRPLKDCARIHLSKQEVLLSYFDGSSERFIGSCIEVDGQWLDGLCQEKQVERLSDKDGRSRLQATCTTDFQLLKLSDYGIGSLNGTNSLVLLGGSQDKERFADLNHAGFMVTKRIPASTSALAQLVRHLSTNTVQHTDMISPASVCGNSLQPKSALGNAAYCYIRNGWRYRLISLNNGSFSGYYPYNGAVARGSMQQVDGLNLAPQAAVVVEDGLENTKETADASIQANLVPSQKDCAAADDDDDDGFIDDDWNDSSDASQNQYNNINICNLYGGSYLPYPQDNEGNTSDMEYDGSDISESSATLNEYSDAYDDFLDSQSDGLQEDHDDDDQGGDCNTSLLLDKCKKNAKQYYNLLQINQE